MTKDVTERTQARGRQRAARVEPYLFLVLEGARLDAGGLRIALAGLEELSVGRGAARALTRSKTTTASLSVPDARMSTTHAKIVRRDTRFHFDDAGSTNGALVNGDAISSHVLQDGDVLELGQSIFVYREIEEDAPGRATDLALLAATPAGLATLDPNLARRFDRLARMATSPLSVLLLGETGTGKEVLANAIHTLSKRPGPFVAVNCGAIPHNLVESHLFGHVRGAFSGAVTTETGVIRSANFGTLLLDEIGDLPASSQTALLRVLQEGEVVPVGSAQAARVDVRIVAATHMPVEELVERGTFRRDLYARLAGYSFSLPPLRERTVDLGLLVSALLASGKVVGPKGVRLHRDAARALVSHDWPMNIRELEQCLRAAWVLAEDGVITLDDLPPAVAASLGAAEEPEVDGAGDAELRRDLLVRLVDANGNVSEVARAMGKARQQIQRWLRRFKIDPEAYRAK